MKIIEFAKLFIALFSMLGTIVVSRLHTIKATKIRVEILKEFEEAMKHNNKNSATEIFRMLYGLRMNYEDIANLIGDNNVNQIIFALRKTPGLVKYENGKFDYSEFHKKSIIRVVNKISPFVWILISAMLIVFFTSLMVSSDNLFHVGIGLLFIILSSLGLVFGVNEFHYNKMVDKLVIKK